MKKLPRIDEIIGKAAASGICTTSEAFVIACCVMSCINKYTSPEMETKYGTLFVEGFKKLVE